MQYLLQCLILAISISLLGTTTSINAQNAQTIYEQALNDINCYTAKVLLRSFDRPVAANNIKRCTFVNIQKEVNGITENKTKGYKKMILDIIVEVNNAKTGLSNPNNYTAYENALRSAQHASIEGFQKICKKFGANNSRICYKYNDKYAQLERDVTNTVNNALKNIKQYTTNNSDATPSSATTSESEATSEIDSPTHDTETITSHNDNNENVIVRTPYNSKRLPLWATIVLIVLSAIIVWLYKEQSELKEELKDIKRLLKVLNQKK